MNKTLITPEKIKAAFVKKGYKFFENDLKNYNINLFGIRSSDMTPDKFNDAVCIMWRYKGVWTTKIYDATTDPGLYYLKDPMNVHGTAIMVPGQYPGCYEVGLHKGYPALRQKLPMKYYRDVDRDAQFDLTGKIYEEVGFTDIHHASNTAKSTVVANWSAGCQVIADINDWNEFLSICESAKNAYSNSFTYTLLNESDIV
ncbi:MAG: hypothetical protein WC979_02270 [Candidatus Pacearchaeota archaeon]|jgi:hypothetical protein